MNRFFLLYLTLFCLMASCSSSEKHNPDITDFSALLLPAAKDGGFKMEEYWIWGGSAIKGTDGQYHLFASRWPKQYPFNQGYVYHSEVVHAVSDLPEGPYAFKGVALPRRSGYWDGKMTHNPTIQQWGDTYYLFYIGSTYEGESPDADSLRNIRKIYKKPAYKNIRIGVAQSTSLDGPWERLDTPILAPQPNGFDSVVVTNPAPYINEDGSVDLIYRTHIRGTGNRLAYARAEQPLGPYRRVLQAPISTAIVEDPFIWKQDSTYYILAKDMEGTITGEKHAGVFLTANDLTQWSLAEQPKAFSRKVQWSDGTQTVQGSFERPQLLIQHGKPTHLFAATADGPGGFRNANHTWNMVIPLKQPE
jgi:hypothetical protein